MPNRIHRLTAPPLLRILLAAALLTGCATLQQRIQNDNDFFTSLPPEHQQIIQHGEIAIGFSRREVQLAWGAPNHKTITKQATGTVETWFYTRLSPDRHEQIISPFQRTSGGWQSFAEPSAIWREQVTEAVLFVDNRVDSWTVYLANPPLDSSPP